MIRDHLWYGRIMLVPTAQLFIRAQVMVGVWETDKSSVELTSLRVKLTRYSMLISNKTTETSPRPDRNKLPRICSFRSDWTTLLALAPSQPIRNRGTLLANIIIVFPDLHLAHYNFFPTCNFRKTTVVCAQRWFVFCAPQLLFPTFIAARRTMEAHSRGKIRAVQWQDSMYVS